MGREIAPQELSYFYQKTGEAIWHLQFVEDYLIKLYLVGSVHLNINGITRQNAESKCKQFAKKTLGQLIGLLDGSEIVSDEFVDKLKAYNDIRKWVVHNSMRETENCLYSQEDRDYFISRTTKFTDMSVEIQKDIEARMWEITIDGGISPEKVMAHANATVEQWKKAT
ncbi:TPA: hypothetical protein ACX3EK_004579 [Vibrio parahaemolyticus]|uniref:hypothetical protein n=2 Tax=Vibrio harveyi group TaxID=717610 RepID=UPI00100FD105|nr:hypothetical protein [Vibrio parahaemolyticus]EJV9314079.1 hypothetical protein [Vibrio vulnificus]EJR0682602.1 hypothetical protein [Vibrio parahaemolyticus]MBE3749062.1 hypothetical protein [Vibrio parahaemolyticus]MDF4372276.1 hypothetical protein [Vibrio parahaemolyticus]MDF4694679.1 hypothetical protein [Vibrio parahaemolyticus]